MDFYLANHAENSANEIQVIQAKIIIDLENCLADAALFRLPELSMYYLADMYSISGSGVNTQNMTNPTIVSPVKMEYG